jgi:hypothetical protein
MRNGNSNKLFGEIVPNSLLLWDPSIKPPSSRGRRRANAEAWDNIPDVIRNSNIAADHVDYHGNFTAEIFEDLFENSVLISRNNMDPLIFTWMVLDITNVGLNKCHHRMQKRM